MAGLAVSSQSFARGLLFAALYVAAISVSVALLRLGGNVTPIWIASAVLTWALLVTPPRDWPLLIGLCAIGHVVRALLAGEQPLDEAIYLLNNMVGPIACAVLLRWRGDALDFADRESVLRFLIVAGIIAPAISSLFIAVGVFVDPRRFTIDDLDVWFLADALSYLVFLPVFKSLATSEWRDLVRPAMRTRSFILFGILIAAHAIDWFLPDALRRHFPTVLIPYMIFMAFELGVSGARIAIVISTVSLLTHALLAVSTGRPTDPVDYILTVQIYLAAMVACVFPLAAALGEKQRLYEQVSDSLADAQAAWGGLIAAEAHYRLVADNTSEMILRLGLDGPILFASPACRALATKPESLHGRNFVELVHPDDAGAARSFITRALAEGSLDHPHKMQLRLRNTTDSLALYDVRLTLVASGNREPEEFIAVLRQVQ